MTVNIMNLYLDDCKLMRLYCDHCKLHELVF